MLKQWTGLSLCFLGCTLLLRQGVKTRKPMWGRPRSGPHLAAWTHGGLAQALPALLGFWFRLPRAAR